LWLQGELLQFSQARLPVAAPQTASIINRQPSTIVHRPSSIIHEPINPSIVHHTGEETCFSWVVA
jgi:hypothetical protein